LKVRLPVAASFLDLNSDRDPDVSAVWEDQSLSLALRDGSEQAYETLLARFQQPVYALALRLLNDPSDASDVVQEVFLKVFRNIGAFRGQSSLKTWIYRITVNEAHNSRRWFFRHRKREVDLDEDPETSRSLKEVIPDSSRSPYEIVLDGEQHSLIEAALLRINPTFREAVVLRDLADLSYDEIADVLGVSLGTVKSRILRGREALREQLAGRLEQTPSLRLVPKTAE
jgi:RNA polymerase sigma-70 factor (ECF subfamily)